MNQITVTRGDTVESTHRVHVAVVDGDGRLLARVGDPAVGGFLRSAAKPWQALPLVEDGAAEAFGFTDAELALCCASHNTEPEHLNGVRSMLSKIGLDESHLECGPHLPIREAVTRDLLGRREALRGVHNNCSGKHTGMLALALHHGWTPAGYLSGSHPVQLRMMREVARWTSLEPCTIPIASDGCGIPTYWMSCESLARGFARFAGGGAGAERVVGAMTGHPFMVAGTGRLCTDLMNRAGDRVYCKTGAEGVYGAGRVDGSLGIGLKVEDGGTRASGAALVEVLVQLGVLTVEDARALAVHWRAPVLNTLGDRVGDVRPEFELERL